MQIPRAIATQPTTGRQGVGDLLQARAGDSEDSAEGEEAQLHLLAEPAADEVKPGTMTKQFSSFCAK
jgi:hypothetical protein